MSGHSYRRRGPLDRRQPRVLDVAPGLVDESGPRRDRAWNPERVAVMAHWSDTPEPSRSVVEIMRALDSAGYDTVLVSAADVVGPLSRECGWAPGRPELPEGTTVLRRANVGYDFGSWAAVLDSFPGVRRARRTLLVNDSVLGPLGPLEPVLADYEACPQPVWGLVESSQHRVHLQSFFVGFKDGVLDTAPMREFWTGIRVERRKSKVVRYGELGLAEALDGAGIGWRAMVQLGSEVSVNPSLQRTAELIEQGVPFSKRVPGHRPPVGPGSEGADARGLLGPDPDPRGSRGSRPLLSRAQRIRFALDVEGFAGVLGARLRPRRGSMTESRSGRPMAWGGGADRPL